MFRNINSAFLFLMCSALLRGAEFDPVITTWPFSSTDNTELWHQIPPDALRIIAQHCSQWSEFQFSSIDKYAYENITMPRVYVDLDLQTHIPAALKQNAIVGYCYAALALILPILPIEKQFSTEKTLLTVKLLQTGRLKLEKDAGWCITNYTPRGWQLFEQQTNNMCYIQKLCLRSVEEPAYLTSFFKLLKTNNRIVFLNLVLNHIGDTQVLADALTKNTTLKKLYLLGNDMDGALIFKGLKENKALTSLRVAAQSFYGDCIRNIGDMFTKNSSLKNLQFGVFFTEPTLFQCISATHINSLATMLQQNTSLSSFELYENKIESGSLQLFAQALRVNTTLRRLALNSLWLSMYEDDIIPVAQACINHNTTLMELCLDGLGLGSIPNGYPALISLAESNDRKSDHIISYASPYDHFRIVHSSFPKIQCGPKNHLQVCSREEGKWLIVKTMPH